MTKNYDKFKSTIESIAEKSIKTRNTSVISNVMTDYYWAKIQGILEVAAAVLNTKEYRALCNFEKYLNY